MTVENLAHLGQTFKILRATPIDADHQWVAAAKNDEFDPFAPDYCGGIYGEPSSPYGVHWDPQLPVAAVDSTVLVVYNAITGCINYGITQGEAEQVLGKADETCARADCLLYDGPHCPKKPHCNKPPNGGGINCVEPVCADGVLQFIAQLCASAALSYFGEGLNLTLTIPNFPDPDSIQIGCPSTGGSFPGCGNWKPFSFNIGSCGHSVVDVDLIYIGCNYNTGGCELTYNCGDSTYVAGNVLVYAPVRFSLANKDGTKSSFKKACFLKVDANNDCFHVFFAQTRLCDGKIDILIISSLVDLSCLYWGGSVFVITSPRPRYTLY